MVISENPLILKEMDRERSFNIRIETNYAPINYLEVGLYTGLMPAPVDRILGFSTEEEFMNYEGFFETEDGITIIPSFGLNVNLQILPFIVKKENCRWDLYICAKYGGSIITKVKFPYLQSVGETANRYNHEYGIGIGGGVYFWNLVGLYTECSFGQFSFKPTLFKQWFSFRAGLTFKWYSKKKIEKNTLNTNSVF